MKKPSAICATCCYSGQLPSISPERLFFLLGDAVRTFAFLSDDAVAVSVQGVVHRISSTEWAHYQALCRHSADFQAATA